MKPLYYVSGIYSGLGAAEAKKLASERMPAIAKPQDRADWCVWCLKASPVVAGQEPFELSVTDHMILEAYRKPDTAAKLRMQAAAKRLCSAKDLRHSQICADIYQEIVADYFEARDVFLRTSPSTRRQRKADRRAKRMLTYPPSAAAEYRDSAFKYLAAAAVYRRVRAFVFAESMLDMAAGEQIAAKNNGFYLP